MVKLSEIQIKAGLKQRGRMMYLGVTDARAIQETQEVQQRQPREESPVYLSDELRLVDARNVHVGIVDYSHSLLAAVFGPSFPLLNILRLFGLRSGHVVE